MFPSLPCSSLLTLFFSGLIPHLLGDVVFLWGCNLLAHFINAYLVDDSVSDTPGGLGNDQNPGSQVGWNKDLSIFPCTADAQGQGQTRGLWDLSTKVLRARISCTPRDCREGDPCRCLNIARCPPRKGNAVVVARFSAPTWQEGTCWGHVRCAGAAVERIRAGDRTQDRPAAGSCTEEPPGREVPSHGLGRGHQQDAR